MHLVAIYVVHSYGVRADYFPADLSKVTEIEALCSEVTRLYPDGVDILINNAGWSGDELHADPNFMFFFFHYCYFL